MGPGLKDGLMHSFKGEFNVDTKDAGPGEVRVRIGGPPGQSDFDSLALLRAFCLCPNSRTPSEIEHMLTFYQVRWNCVLLCVRKLQVCLFFISHLFCRCRIKSNQINGHSYNFTGI